MRCEQVRDLAPLHVVGLLDTAETAAVREHLLAGCPGCAAEVAAHRQTIEMLPLALPPHAPSPMAKAQLMARIRRESEAGRGVAGRGASWSVLSGAAAAAAILGALATSALMNGRHRELAARYEAEAASLRERVDSQREELASLRREVRNARQSIQLASAPGVTMLDLAGQATEARAAARVFWDRATGSWQLFAANLSAPAAGKTYQLWIITKDAKISAGVFDSATGIPATGSLIVSADAGEVLAAAVTDEPAGGSPQPTGSILLLGKV